MEAAEGEAPSSLLNTVLGWRGSLDRHLSPGWAGHEQAAHEQCLSSGKGESRAPSRAQAQGRGGHCPLHIDQARVARAGGSSQHRRNVL